MRRSRMATSEPTACRATARGWSGADPTRWRSPDAGGEAGHLRWVVLRGATAAACAWRVRCRPTFGGMQAGHLHIPRRMRTGSPRPAAHPESWATELRWFAAAAATASPSRSSDERLGACSTTCTSPSTSLPCSACLRPMPPARSSTSAGRSPATGSSGRAGRRVRLRAGPQCAVRGRDTPPRWQAYYMFELDLAGGLRRGRRAAAEALPSWALIGARWATWRRGDGGPRTSRSLALVVTITAVYHLGYEQYRHNGVGAPETGNTLISMPMLLSTNPIGSIADRMAMHVSAVAHTYETEVRLPRRRRRSSRPGDPDGGPPRSAARHLSRSGRPSPRPRHVPDRLRLVTVAQPVRRALGRASGRRA